jgi:antitoxin CptB
LTKRGDAPSSEPKALRWRQRRGMKELDVLFERYYSHHYVTASREERATFEKLLRLEDPQIWLWVVNQDPVPAEFANVIDALRRHD